jgi:dihydroorotase
MLVRNARLADGRVRDVRIDGERIEAVGTDLEGTEVVDAAERLLLPGGVDAHVHFREPGAPHKETWRTGSRSAAAGGVTTVVDQPNTDPPTTTGAAYDQKELRADDSVVDYGINGGVTPDWDPETLFDRPVFALGEVFLADSTGDMGIDDTLFEDAVHRASEAGVAVTVHAEDATLFDGDARDRAGEGTGRGANADAWSAYRTAEAEIAAVERAVEIGADAGARLHVAHTSTPEAVDVVADAPGTVTCEVTPHHCLLSREDPGDLGTFGRMNPPLRSEKRRSALYDRVVRGRVDLVATDHAPHAREEKEARLLDAPSGVPGVETMVPLLLAETLDGPLTIERVRDLTAANPADAFGLDRKGRVAAGMDADLALYDLDRARPVRGTRLHSKCGWTPFEGRTAVFPEWTLVRGDRVYDGAMDTFGMVDGENIRG